MRELRFPKRSSRSHRKAKPSRLTLRHLFHRTPKHADYGPLPELPPASMQQRPMPPRQVHPQMPSDVELNAAARRLTGSFSGHFRLNGDLRLFRDDDMTWNQFENARQARLRRMQDLVEPWAAPNGVNLGMRHSPKTLVFSLTDYDRFSDGTDVQPAVKP